MAEKGALPKNNSKNEGETIPTPAAEPTPTPEPQTKAPEIKKGTSKILEPKYDKMYSCDYDKCPITKKQILFGMHCVFYEKNTYHALCELSAIAEEAGPLRFDVPQKICPAMPHLERVCAARGLFRIGVDRQDASPLGCL